MRKNGEKAKSSVKEKKIGDLDLDVGKIIGQLVFFLYGSEIGKLCLQILLAFVKV